MSERGIASILKVSHMSINRTMRDLANVNLVDFITIGKAHLWKVNRKSYAYKTLSRLITDTSGIKNPLEDLKITILRNLPRALIKKVILFGSITKSSERTDSDIDLFILVQNKQNKQKLESAIEKLSNICLEVYGNRLAPYILTEQEIKQKNGLNIIAEINEGIQIFPEKKN